MHYAQRLLAALPSTRLGARAILAVLTAFGIIFTTAGVAAMPLLNEGKAVEESEGGVACRPAARMVYPEGQSAPEYVVPVYETKYGVESIAVGVNHGGTRELRHERFDGTFWEAS